EVDDDRPAVFVGLQPVDPADKPGTPDLDVEWLLNCQQPGPPTGQPAAEALDHLADPRVLAALDPAATHLEPRPAAVELGEQLVRSPIVARRRLGEVVHQRPNARPSGVAV